MTQIIFFQVSEEKKHFPEEIARYCSNDVSPIKDISFMPNAISLDDANDILKFIDGGGLGKDPTSDYFIRREKCIRYVMTYGDSFFSLVADYLIQPYTYNQFSGGYKRNYTLCPDSLVQTSMGNTIKMFIKHNNLPNKTIIKVHLQSSYIKGTQI